jgi:hypothetical protein
LSAGVLSFAVLFFVVAVVIEMTAPFDIPVWGREVPSFVAGFFGMYGIMTAAIGLFGYAVLFAARFVSVVRDKMGPTAA